MGDNEITGTAQRIVRALFHKKDRRGQVFALPTVIWPDPWPEIEAAITAELEESVKESNNAR